MNARILFIAAAFTAGLFFNSCEKDESIPGPVVTITELGHGNSKTGIAGSDLHIDAEVVAEGRIDRITISIHPEHSHGTKGLNDDKWEVDTTFTEYSGLKNTKFHKDIDIPAGAKPGHYHFTLTVTDMEGQQTAIDDEIEILQP